MRPLTIPRERLFALEQFGIKLGLDNIGALVDALDQPERAWPAIHVAGTNGKGSVTAMVERGLRAAGHRTGRYTSPHLDRHRGADRRSTAGRSMPARFDASARRRVRRSSIGLRATGALPATPTFFEVTTAMAFEIFRARASGRGGDRSRARRPVRRHQRHHAARSPPSRRSRSTTSGTWARRWPQIAFEKAGIIKPGVPVVVGDAAGRGRWPSWRGGPRAWARRSCRPRVGRTRSSIDARPRAHAAAHAGWPDLRPARAVAARPHQVDNAVDRRAGAAKPCTRPGMPLTGEARGRRVDDARWPARLEWLRAGGRANCSSTRRTTRPGPKPWRPTFGPRAARRCPIVLAVMQDKDVDAMARAAAAAGVGRSSRPARARRARSRPKRWPRALRALAPGCRRHGRAPIRAPRSPRRTARDRRAVGRGLDLLRRPAARPADRRRERRRFDILEFARAASDSSRRFIRRLACRSAAPAAVLGRRAPRRADRPGLGHQAVHARTDRRRSHPADAGGRDQRQSGSPNAGQKIFADEVEWNTRTGEFTAVGNVVFRHVDARMSAERVVFNTKTRRGTFYQRLGHGLARRARRAGSEHVRHARAGHLFLRRDDREDRRRQVPDHATARSRPACSRRRAGRSSAARATINLDDYAMLNNAVIRVKDVPVFYLPVLYYPIQDDDRATGFLLPTYGRSTYRGQSLSNAFFWAINRSQDATLLPRLVHLARPGRRHRISLHPVAAVAGQLPPLRLEGGGDHTRVRPTRPGPATSWRAISRRRCPPGSAGAGPRRLLLGHHLPAAVSTTISISRPSARVPMAAACRARGAG